MARNERESSDLLSVEYFSQLPFLRPVPPSKQKGSGSAIRLFGQDVGNNSSSGAEGEASSRRFECHYCCRNFPTSQALGGHQNAHKRERQNAKRAHLQSFMSVDTHDYRMMNYGRFGSLPPPHAAATTPLYNGHLSQPIRGSPLGLWRIPAAENPSLYSQERVSLPLPIHRQIPLDEQLKPLASVSSLASQNRFVFESKPSIRDHVSLDLHL